MPQLILTSFGAFQVSFNQAPVVAFESNKARALLAYLAVESAHAHARTTLAGLFWPEIRENNARDNLRHALTNLRNILHNHAVDLPFLLSDRQTVQFNAQSNHHLDVADFTQSIKRYRRHGTTIGTGSSATEPLAALEHAASLYRGAFLDGLFLDDCSAFEEWLLLTRERLHHQMLTTLTTLVDHFEQVQAYDQAENYARRLIALDNLQEQAHCSLMRIFAGRGQRSAALSQYEHYRQLLANEIGAPPSAETVALHQQIQRGLWQSPQPPSSQRVSVVPVSGHTIVPPPPQHNLPLSINSFVGRIREVTEICRRLRQPDVRLLTLHGTGGVGKTRLALQAARQLLQDFPAEFGDGCGWVELAPLREAAQLPRAIAQSLGVGGNNATDPRQGLKTYLRDKALLLVIDNYEHLLDGASLVAELLSQAPRLKCLVTSREPLHVRGEHEFAVPTLTLPTADQPSAPADRADCEAVQLFIQRAQAVSPAFTVDNASGAVVAAICTQLDGLPLAIELAAVRIKFFSAQTLRQKIESARLTFLRGARDMPERHQTLHSTIAWSYDLLSAAEKKLFRRLAVFVGSFTSEAVAHVCVLTEEDAIEGAGDVSEILISLVDKNLVRQSLSADAEARFWLLETIREFGGQMLAASDTVLTIQHQHANFYHDLAGALCPHLVGANSVRSLTRLRQEYPNVRAALEWFLTNRQAEPSISLCNHLLHYWSSIDSNEALGYLEAALNLAADLPPTVAYINALANAGYAALVLDVKGSGREYFERCLALNAAAGNIGDPMKIGTANGLLGWINFEYGDYQTGRAYLATAKQNDLAKGAEWPLAMTLLNQGTMEARLGEFAEANRLLAEGLTIMRRLDDAWGIAGTLLRQGRVYIWQNRMAEAADVVAQSQSICQALQSDGWMADWHSNAALIATHHGEEEQANQHLREALLLRQKNGVPRYLLQILEPTILIFVSQNRDYAGLAIASAIHAYRQKLNFVAPPVEKKLIDDAVAQARQQLTPAVANAAWATGAAITLNEAMIYALADESSRAQLLNFDSKHR
jgi:predicted ATPase/DNA-binding SARP family transcriptional activator